MKTPKWVKNLYHFYHEGFTNMTVGKKLWGIVILKLFIMFGILKVFFFPNFLNTKFEKEEDKANFVNQELINRSSADLSDTTYIHKSEQSN